MDEHTVIATWVMIGIFSFIALLAEFWETEVLSIIFSVVYISLGIILETSVHGFTVIFALIGYMLIGYVWSLVRYKMFLKDELAWYSRFPDYYVGAISCLTPARSKVEIIGWILNWPMSIIERGIRFCMRQVIKRIPFTHTYSVIFSSVTGEQK